MSDNKRRSQAIAGVLCGALVVAVLVGVFFVVRDGSSEAPVASQPTATTQPAAPVPPSAEPSAAASTAAAGGSAALSQEPDVQPGTGAVTALTVKELVPGTGEKVKAGQTITVNYKVINYLTGEQIDSSWKNGVSEPFSAQIGVGQLIPGWDQAVPGQKVGSRIQLDVPAALAYGPEQGDLRFVVDIVSAE
ncbi:FKBP-type peptidyl-prolyl cis-trans isomerase [Actinoplanes hulinensis]|uniref:Peptidyl-prolyl cis-trans isomerase n=1 Tax=Actinoplanes hulinensis TaxID=1144547 RepID=A0ABS7B2X2_9ACTN|nr:FKBP-type peptidyl-prolyl cis-trans isomerase [Actinoplanes hulinensis]MBW6435262.1 FKBP-type peptidyl-prolyl cis-trans isomerase [Actinoplanes hulinensis]